MTKELTRLQPETLAAAEQYFRSASVSVSVLSVRQGCFPDMSNLFAGTTVGL